MILWVVLFGISVGVCDSIGQYTTSAMALTGYTKGGRARQGKAGQGAPSFLIDRLWNSN